MQPMPVPGKRFVIPRSREMFETMLSQREAKGIATYGVSLQTNNGRDALLDAMEECLDQWNYLVQLWMEREEVLHRSCPLPTSDDETWGPDVLGDKQ